jgi:hypothetical protein
LKVKLGDKYAIVHIGRREDVHGPWYVTSIRGSLASLSRENKPDPKASRSWRIDDKTGEMSCTTQWSMQRAEPWAEKHLVALRRKHLEYKVAELFDAHRREGYESLSTPQLFAMFKILKPKTEKKDGDASESEGSGEGTG